MFLFGSKRFTDPEKQKGLKKIMSEVRTMNVEVPPAQIRGEK